MPIKKVLYDNVDKNYIFNCPHCDEIIIVHFNDTACCIFRHAVLKSNLEQINPHSPKSVCEELVQKDLIYGCGKPFFFHKKSKPPYVEECDYI